MLECLRDMNLPEYVTDILAESKGVVIPKTRKDLLTLAMGNSENTEFFIEYEVEGKGNVLEATATKCKNGVVVNYADDYMRRRDPDCLLIADHKPTDKPRYDEVYHSDFETLRTETFDWLKKQELISLVLKN